MKSYIYKRKNGDEIHFRYTADRIIETEQRTGKALSELYKEIDKLGTIFEIISSAMVGGNHDERQEKALAIYEEIVEDGGTILDLQLIVIEIYRNSGFLTPHQAEAIVKIITMQKRLMGAKAEDSAVTQN